MRNTLIGTLSMLAVSLALLAVLLVYGGFVQLNNPSDYSVRGVDASSYQGVIDWQTLSSQDIKFAYIKATEGSGYTDPCFEFNAAEAAKTNLAVGAYHFFSYDSGGAEQAEHFIAAIDGKSFALPPVIDLEFYGDYEKHPKAAEDVKLQLSEMIMRLRRYYGRSPIIYVTEKSYELYKDCLDGCDLWVRSVFSKPDFAEDWLIWQYSNRTVLNGYSGKERYIDMNALNGALDVLLSESAD